MPISVDERILHVAGSDDSREKRYIAKGSSVEADIRAAVLAEAPETYQGLAYDDIDLDQRVDSDDEDRCVWYATVSYREPGQVRSTPATGDSAYSFEIGGETIHVSESIQTRRRYGTNAPNHHGAIDVQRDGDGAIRIVGTDIEGPTFAWSETHYIAAASVTSAYKGKLFAIKDAPVNDASFKGFSAGECRFLGASGSTRGDGSDFEIVFRFAARPNKTGLTIPYAPAWSAATTYNKGSRAYYNSKVWRSKQDSNTNNTPVADGWWAEDANAITGIAKYGWDYLWVEYAPELDDDSKRLIMRPIAAHAEQVYEWSDFSELGIGT